MKASKFTEAQKAFILQQSHDGMALAEICRKAGISQATHFQLEEEVRRVAADGDAALKQVEDENSKLRKVVADLSFERAMLQDVIHRKL